MIRRTLSSTLRASAAAAMVLSATACGGSPSSPSAGDATITISSSGVSPTEVRIPVGGRVTFLNNDSRPHAMSSDPIQVHTDCPPINDVGFVNPGQTRQTGAMTVKRTCGFHDHTNETDPTYQGRIIIE